MDPGWLFVSLIPSGIGFVLLTYGKKLGRWIHVLAGVTFIAYPYFTDTVGQLIGIGVVLGAALWLAVRAGW